MTNKEIKQLYKKLDRITQKCNKLTQKIAVLQAENDHDLEKVREIDEYFKQSKDEVPDYMLDWDYFLDYSDAEEILGK